MDNETESALVIANKPLFEYVSGDSTNPQSILRSADAFFYREISEPQFNESGEYLGDNIYLVYKNTALREIEYEKGFLCIYLKDKHEVPQDTDWQIGQVWLHFPISDILYHRLERNIFKVCIKGGSKSYFLVKDKKWSECNLSKF